MWTSSPSRVDIARGQISRRALSAGIVAGPLMAAASFVQIPFRDGFDMTRHAGRSAADPRRLAPTPLTRPGRAGFVHRRSSAQRATTSGLRYGTVWLYVAVTAALLTTSIIFARIRTLE